MAGEVHGSRTRVHLAGYNVSRHLRQQSTDESIDTAEKTVFADEAKRYEPGLGDGTFSFEGFYNRREGELNEALERIKRDPKVPVTVWPSGDAVGADGETAAAIKTAKGVATEIGDMVKVTFELQATGGVQDVVSFFPFAELPALDAVGEAEALDNGEGAASGVLCVHVEEFDGADLDVVVEDSPDDDVYTPLVSAVEIEGGDGSPQGVRVSIPGPVERWVRVAIATESGTADVVCAAAFGWLG